MLKQIVAAKDARETRVALLEEGRAVEIYVERPSSQRVVGNIYKGRVANVLPGMQAAFVDIGLDKNAFLYVDDCDQTLFNRSHPDRKPNISDLVSVNQEIIVQVSKEAVGNKGPRVTQQLNLPGRYLVLMPGHMEAAVSRRIDDPLERERLQMIVSSLIKDSCGVIARTASVGISEKMIREDFKFLFGLWKRLEKQIRGTKAPNVIYRDVDLIRRTVRDLFTIEVDRFVTDSVSIYKDIKEIITFIDPVLETRVVLEEEESIFSKYRVEQELEKALRRKIWLRNGGYIVIDHTEALTVIDVNTGKYTGTISPNETVMRTNLEAAKEIARQIRLRDIGGMILIDFIDMENDQQREELLQELEAYVKKDRTKTQVVGSTRLGLVEMTRKKVRQSLDEVMQKLCSNCDGRGKVMTEEAIAAKIERLIREQIVKVGTNEVPPAAIFVEAHPLVAASLIGPGGAFLESIEQDLNCSVFVKGRDSFSIQNYQVQPTQSVEEAEAMAIPVKLGQVVEVFVEELHTYNPRNGIARMEGYVVDVEQGGMYVGQHIPVTITQVHRTYAKGQPNRSH